jgi:hypothetical protein
LAPTVDDVEITRLVDTAIYYLEGYSAEDARGEFQVLTLWLALVNIEHAILCLRLTDRTFSHLSGGRGRALSNKKRKKISPRKKDTLETYKIGRSIQEITSGLASIKIASKDSNEFLSELRSCRDVLVKAIRRHSSIS